MLMDPSGAALSVDRVSSAVGFDASTCDVVNGTEIRWPQSHSARLLLRGQENGNGVSEKAIYFKKTMSKLLPKCGIEKLRMTLASYRCEARFYAEFASEYRRNGVGLAHAFLAEDQLAEADESDEEKLRSGGTILFLEDLGLLEGYGQFSPITAPQAMVALSSLAAFHAAGWENVELLERASSRLHDAGCWYALSRRGEAELNNILRDWSAFMREFTPLYPDVLADKNDVAERLVALAPWVSLQLQAHPRDPFATLIHGDCKAMNIFLPATGEVGAKLIDFQWCGPGLGMTDVATLIIGSVEFEAGAAEEQVLVDHYCRELRKRLSPQAAAAYSTEVAMRHYRLSVLDYARSLMSRGMVKDASPEAFAASNARGDSKNIPMYKKDPRVAPRLVALLDAHLRSFELEEGAVGRQAKQGPSIEHCSRAGASI